jgi:hypothetical protein
MCDIYRIDILVRSLRRRYRLWARYSGCAQRLRNGERYCEWRSRDSAGKLDFSEDRRAIRSDFVLKRFRIVEQKVPLTRQNRAILYSTTTTIEVRGDRRWDWRYAFSNRMR